eukprot:Rmarinus@m.16260
MNFLFVLGLLCTFCVNVRAFPDNQRLSPALWDQSFGRPDVPKCRIGMSLTELTEMSQRLEADFLFDSAIECMQVALADDEAAVRPAMRLGRLLGAAQRHLDAISVYERVLSDLPSTVTEYVDLNLRIALHLGQLDQHEKAVEHQDNAILSAFEVAGWSGVLMARRACTDQARKFGFLDDAITHARAAADLAWLVDGGGPTCAAVEKTLVDLLLERHSVEGNKDDTVEAEKHAVAVVSAMPDDPHSWRVLAAATLQASTAMGSVNINLLQRAGAAQEHARFLFQSLGRSMEAEVLEDPEGDRAFRVALPGLAMNLLKPDWKYVEALQRYLSNPLVNKEKDAFGYLKRQLVSALSEMIVSASHHGAVHPDMLARAELALRNLQEEIRARSARDVGAIDGFSSVLPALSDPRNVILTTIDSLGPKMVSAFLHSARHTARMDAEIVMFTTAVTDALEQVARKYDALIVEYDEPPATIPYHELHNYRFFLYRNYLKKHGERYAGKSVLVTDARDVVFQRDPFSCAREMSTPTQPQPDLILSLEADARIGSDERNRRWFQGCAGDAALEGAWQHPIVCGGVMMGQSKPVLRTLDLMVEQLTRLKTDMCTDQGALNYLLASGKLAEVGAVSLSSAYHGPIASVGRVRGLSLAVEGDQHVIVNSEQEPLCLVHQYDRFQSLLDVVLRESP